MNEKSRWMNNEPENINLGAKKMCFNCNEAEHSHIGCTNPPFCYACRKSGHKARQCPNRIELQTCGFGILGMGFYSIHLPEEENRGGEEISGLLTVLEGYTDEKTIEAEIRYLLKGQHQWNIKNITEKEFYIKFPTTEMRGQLTKFTSFESQTSSTESTVKVKVEAIDRPVEASNMLEKVWVKAFNFPHNAPSSLASQLQRST